MMGTSPIILQRSSDTKAPGFFQIVSSLYRTDPIWQSALDMVVIGLVVRLLANGVPPLFYNILTVIHNDSAISPSPANVPATAQPTASIPASVPNFAPPPTGAANIKEVPDAIPEKHHMFGFVEKKDWHGKLTPEQEKLLLETYNDVEHNQCHEAVLKLTPLVKTGGSDFEMAFAIAQTCNDSDPNHKEQAFYWQNQAAMHGNPYAQYQLGMYYRLGFGVEADIYKARQWYEKSALGKIGAADNELGRIYQFGNGVPKNLKKAAAYYMEGAERGDSWSQLNTGVMYFKGITVPKNYNNAIVWMEKAAQQGNEEAQLDIAIVYLTNSNGAQYDKFLEWAGKAADQGDVKAMTILADYYRKGTGGKIDNAQAAMWYRRAALKKNAEAQFMLARMYAAGTGVPQDNIQAYVYYSLAQEGGFGQANSELNNLQTHMTTSQLEHAKSLTNALIAKHF